MTSTLDGMDRSRRAAVRALLVQEATTLTPAPPAPSHSTSTSTSTSTPTVGLVGRRSKLVLTSALGLAAAVVAITATAAVVYPTPAYAVSGGNGEEVTVQVNRLEGAEGLEDELTEHGVTADVTYLPSNTACAPGRYTAVRTPGLTLSVSAGQFEVTIPAGAVGTDQTFVLSASVTEIADGVRANVNFDIAQGAVAPCTVVDAI